jgi:hypothetical protein
LPVSASVRETVEPACDLLSAAALPLPGSGRTWERFEGLAERAARDLSGGQLSEGHADAVAILAETGREPSSAGLHGVWAERDSGNPLRATHSTRGWRLDGRLPFCSGSGIVERALVVADSPEGRRLFEVDAAHPGVVPVPGTWPAVGMAASRSSAVAFSGVPAEPVGPPGFYTGRVGFWRGAAGVAACWWGGSKGLVDTLGHHLRAGSPGPAELAAFAGAASLVHASRAALVDIAALIDATDDKDRTRVAARLVRDAVHRHGTDVLALIAAAGGARPVCLDEEQSRRGADLYAYLAQHHPGADGAALGAELLGRDARAASS